MLLTEAKQLARRLMRKYGLRDWKFRFTKSRIEMGACLKCKTGEKFIEMSSYYTKVAKDEDIIDTILHEIAHAIVGVEKGHGPEWMEVCEEIGARPEPHMQVAVPGLWGASCGKCGKLYQKTRKPKYLYECPTCSYLLSDWKKC